MVSTKGSTQSHTPRFKRDKDKFNSLLTDRDIAVLEALNQYRYLRTSQIHQLLFSSNNSQQSVRRRLKYLYDEGHIARVQPYFQLGKPTPQIAYYLDTKGRKYLNSLGIETHQWSRRKKVSPTHLNHALDISEFRVLLESSIKYLAEERKDQKTQYFLESFVPDFKIKKHLGSSTQLSRYELYNEVLHPYNKQRYTVYPDAEFILSKGETKKLYYLEIDKGTEGLQVIRDKVTGYNVFSQKERQPVGQNISFSTFRVLFVTTSERRKKNMLNTLVDHEGSKLVWIATLDDLQNTGCMLTHSAWMSYKAENTSIIKPLNTY